MIAGASRLNLAAPGRILAKVATEVFAADRARFQARAARFGKLGA